MITLSHVIDASEGSNYSGGSSFVPRLPLLPSSAGLAGLGAVGDALPDARLMRNLNAAGRALFMKAASQARLRQLLRQRLAEAQRLYKLSPLPISATRYQQRRRNFQLSDLDDQLTRVRAIRLRLERGQPAGW
jgi:hypothetical protein